MKQRTMYHAIALLIFMSSFQATATLSQNPKYKQSIIIDSINAGEYDHYDHRIQQTVYIQFIELVSTTYVEGICIDPNIAEGEPGREHTLRSNVFRIKGPVEDLEHIIPILTKAMYNRQKFDLFYKPIHCQRHKAFLFESMNIKPLQI